MKYFVTLIVFIIIIQICSCSNKTKKIESLKFKIETNLHKGSKLKTVIQYLDSLGIEHSGFIKSENEVHAIIRNSDKQNVVKKNLAVTFRFDDKEILISTKFNELYTGP